MEQKIITSSSASGLNAKIKELIEEGWEPIGSHTISVEEEYAQYAGSQYRRTERKHQFHQSMKKS
jgi:hypothetical protein